MIIVLDTNILVSSLWKKSGPPARILQMVLQGRLRVCWDWRIMQEYRAVLNRPKFNFPPQHVDALLDWIEHNGISVVPDPVLDEFPDASDRKFYEAAVFTNAILITGNRKHFPDTPVVMTAAEFLEKYMDAT